MKNSDDDYLSYIALAALLVIVVLLLNKNWVDKEEHHPPAPFNCELMEDNSILCEGGF